MVVLELMVLWVVVIQSQHGVQDIVQYQVRGSVSDHLVLGPADGYKEEFPLGIRLNSCHKYAPDSQAIEFISYS